MTLHRSSDCQRREPDESITILDYGVSSGPEMSLVRAELHGLHQPNPNRRSQTTYVVVRGTATIRVDGETFEVGADDVVVAPVGTRRALQGDASLVIVNSPAFDPADEA